MREEQVIWEGLNEETILKKRGTGGASKRDCKRDSLYCWGSLAVPCFNGVIERDRMEKAILKKSRTGGSRKHE